MADRPLVQRILAWATLPVLILGIAGARFAKLPSLDLASAALAADALQDEFEQRVRSYLLAHPEVIAEAAIERMLETNNKLAQALHITGTPGFVAGDEVWTGATDFDGLQALISKGREAQQSAK